MTDRKTSAPRIACALLLVLIGCVDPGPPAAKNTPKKATEPNSRPQPLEISPGQQKAADMLRIERIKEKIAKSEESEPNLTYEQMDLEALGSAMAHERQYFLPDEIQTIRRISADVEGMKPFSDKEEALLEKFPAYKEMIIRDRELAQVGVTRKTVKSAE